METPETTPSSSPHEPEAQVAEAAKRKAEEEARQKAEEQQRAEDEAARQLAEKEAAEKRAQEERVAADEKKRQQEAEEARTQEEAKAAGRKVGQANVSGGDRTAGNEGANNRAIKELKTALDEHRRRYNRGAKLWRAWSLLSLHVFILSLAGAIFVNWSASLNANNPPIPTDYRSDIVFGLMIVAVVSLILFLEYLRNWWNFNLRLSQVDKLIIEVTKPDTKLNDIQGKLGKISEKRLTFIGSSTDINKTS